MFRSSTSCAPATEGFYRESFRPAKQAVLMVSRQRGYIHPHTRRHMRRALSARPRALSCRPAPGLPPGLPRPRLDSHQGLSPRNGCAPATPPPVCADIVLRKTRLPSCLHLPAESYRSRSSHRSHQTCCRYSTWILSMIDLNLKICRTRI